MTHITRRKFMATGAGALGASIAFPGLVFGQSRFKLKCANIMPADHPLNVRWRYPS